jgi:lipopolysaccharide export system ATP-binding protein
MLLKAENLVKTYSKRNVVNGISIEVNKGEIVGLLGPNGAGKTTTFYMILGLVKPNEGKIIFNGKDITKEPVYKRARAGLGYLAQEPSIFRKLSVEDNVMAILETLDLTKAQRKERLTKLLDDLKITKLAKQKAFTLSGGERRRLEITRALVNQPELILLDEPFSGVDPLAVSDIQEIIKDLRDSGLSILITDHSVRETLSIVDRAYLQFDGQILTQGESSFLINDEKSRKFYLGDNFTM